MKKQPEFDAAMKSVMELSDNLYGAADFVQKGKLETAPETETIFKLAVLIRDLSEIQTSMVHVILNNERVAELERLIKDSK